MRLPCFGLSLAYKECPVHHEKSCNHVKGILFVHRDILPGLSEVDLPLFSRVVSPNIVIIARFSQMLDSVPYRALQGAYLHYFLLFLHKKGAIYSRDRSTQWLPIWGSTHPLFYL